MTESDADLLRKTACGDREAFERLLDLHEAAVFRLARALVPSRPEAEDVLQETFLAVWRNATAFSGAGSARGWILTITRNAANRQFRRHAGEPVQHEPLEQLGVEAGWAVEDPSFADRVANRELVEIGFRSLSADEKEVLVLRDMEGFSGQEVTAILGISAAAMKSRLHRARLRFVASLREKTNG